MYLQYYVVVVTGDRIVRVYLVKVQLILIEWLRPFEISEWLNIRRKHQNPNTCFYIQLQNLSSKLVLLLVTQS